MEKKLIGKDELNLCECPLTLLTDQAEDRKSLKFTDKQLNVTRKWEIFGSSNGLPCAYDEPVYIAMLALTKADGFKNPRVYFKPLEMLELMKWDTGGKHYTRLKLALDRLIGVTIFTDFLWDDGHFKEHVHMGFHIIDEFRISKGKKGIKSSYFEWSKTVFDSLLNGNVKNLDLNTYFSLSTAISRRFFRLWDKRLYKSDQISFDLQELCHEKLGISRNLKYPSLLKQALNPTLKEHIEKNLLSSSVYRKTKDGKWLLTITKYSKPALPSEEENLPYTKEELKTSKGSLINQLVSLGISEKVAKDLISSVDPQIIKNQIEALPYRKNIENKPAFLIIAIQDNYPLPEVINKKLTAKRYEEESKLQNIYNRFIIAKVDEYLKKCGPAVVEKEMAEHKKLFMDQTGLNEITIQKPGWRDYYELNYKKAKAKALNLISFEDWKKIQNSPDILKIKEV